MTETEANVAGERPLWRRIADFPLVAMIIALALLILANAAAVLLMMPITLPDPATRAIIFSALNVALVVAVYKLVVRHLGEHPRDDLALGAASKGLSIGLLLGFLLFALVVGSAAAVDVYNVSGWGGTGQLLKDLVVVAIATGVIEEIIFRGILFRWIEEFAGSWAALVVTSALFGLAHIFNPNATWFSSFAIAVEAGVPLGGAYMLTRSLWMPIGLHAAWNFTQGYIFDVPVSGHDEQGLVVAKLSGPEILSGGRFGLEASILAIMIGTAAGVWLVVLAARRGELVQPWWVRRCQPTVS